MVIGPDYDDDDDHYCFDQERYHGADDIDDDQYTVLSSMFILYDPVTNISAEPQAETGPS